MGGSEAAAIWTEASGAGMGVVEMDVEDKDNCVAGDAVVWFGGLTVVRASDGKSSVVAPIDSIVVAEGTCRPALS